MRQLSSFEAEVVGGAALTGEEMSTVYSVVGGAMLPALVGVGLEYVGYSFGEKLSSVLITPVASGLGAFLSFYAYHALND